MRRALIICALAASLLGGLATAQPRPGVVRESRAVTVGAARETWRLVETRNLSLVRELEGQVIDRMRLSGLVESGAPPWPGPCLGDLQRWPAGSSDRARTRRGARPPAVAPVMLFGDYDHDGHATEFLVEVASPACGQPEYAVVGVSEDNPRLHAFASGAQPGRPLAMPLEAWEALLRSANPPSVETWRCGEFGSETAGLLQVFVRRGVIWAVDREYACTSGGKAGVLLNESDL
jgi:hypothetical protein